MSKKLPNKFLALLCSLALVFSSISFAASTAAAESSDHTVVWTLDASKLGVPGTVADGEYLGKDNYQPGIQLTDMSSSSIAMYDDGSLGINPSGGTYKAINIQTGTDVGGTNYYTNNGFVAVANKTYTITFNAYVTDGTGQVRVRGNKETDTAEFGTWSSANISSTPTPVSFTWTQDAAGGNMQIDTGSTAQGTVVHIKDLQISTPKTTTVVWSLDAGQLGVPGTVADGEYLGKDNYQPGIQLTDMSSSSIAMYDDGSLGINPSGGAYKAINIQTGTDVGGTNYYTNNGFAAVANKTYTITFNAYVTDGTGQVRVRGNKETDTAEFGTWSSANISTTPTPVSFTWTQDAAGGNLQIDTGSTAQGTVVHIKDLQISTQAESGGVIYDLQKDPSLANGWGSSAFLTKSGTASSPTINVSVSEATYSLSLTGRTVDYDAIDIVKDSLGITSGIDYTFTVTGTAPAGTKMKLSLGADPYNTFKDTTADDNGTYTLTYTGNSVSLTANIRIQTQDAPTADFTISSIIVTASAGSPINPDVLTLPSIKETSPYTGYLMGSILGPNYLKEPILSVLKAQFGVVTPENATKPDSLKGTSATTHNVAQLDFTEADREILAAIDNGLLVHGHTLVWHSQSIPWLNNDPVSSSDSTPSNPGLTPEQADQNLKDYITAVLQHYKTFNTPEKQNIVSWDVVNEAMGGSVRDSSLDPSKWRSYLRNHQWFKLLGADYIEKSFRYARAAEPNYDVKLYYNDFSMDDQKKAAAVRDMVKEINDKWAAEPGHEGTLLIQGVGMQEHNGLGTNPSNTRKSIQMFKDIGVKVSISELDISAGTGGTQTADQKTAQAAQYARLMQVYTDPAFKDTVQRITLWGLTDDASWLAEGSPLLFDKKLYPKDAFYAVIDPAGYLASYHAPTKPPGSKTATAAKGTPNIDGTMDDIWKTTSPIAIDVKQAGNTKAGTIMPKASARMLWDDENLYVFAQVTKDPSEPLDKGNANPWEHDSVEVVVDLTNGSTAMYSNASGHYRVRYDGFATVDAGMSDNQGKPTVVTSRTTVNEATNSYTVEMKIPFIQMPEVGTKLGFDVQVNDAKAGARIGAFAWNDATGTAYQDLFKIGTLELAAAGSDTSSSGSGGGGGGAPASNEPKTELKDGQLIIQPTVETKNGVSKASLSGSDLTKALEKAPVNGAGKKQVTIDIPAQAGATSYEVQLPSASLKDSGSTVLALKTANGTIELPGNMLTGTNIGNAESVTVRVGKASTEGLSEDVRKQIGDKPVINLEVLAGDSVVAWNNPNAPVNVAIPYKPTADELSNPDHIIIWYIDGKGKATPVPNARYDAASGTVKFSTTHFSNYAVAYVVKTFGDLSSVPWAKKAIEAMASRGIINGTSEKTYDPNASIKRADFLLLLVHALELKGTGGTVTMFSDVDSSAYYYDAVKIAKQLGIVQGTRGNLFDPNSPISRQDMMVIAAQAAKAAGKALPTSGTLDAFSDGASVASYAKDSVTALVNAGIVQGSNGKLALNGFLTRAEAAVILQRIWSK